MTDDDAKRHLSGEERLWVEADELVNKALRLFKQSMSKEDRCRLANKIAKSVALAPAPPPGE